MAMPAASAETAVAVKATVTGTVPSGTGTVACPFRGPTLLPRRIWVLASPFASVVVDGGVAAPPAEASSKVKSTGALGTGRCWVSVTLTTTRSPSVSPTRPF
jgi:hypothetical protein